MLLSFKITNSRSIAETLELSMLATEGFGQDEQKTLALTGYSAKLLKAVALFGANASGKSNVLKALGDAFLLIKGLALQKITSYPKNPTADTLKPIEYSFNFVVDEVLYSYSFAHTPDYIAYEELWSWANPERAELIYSRKREGGRYIWEPAQFFEDKSADFFYKSTPSNKLFLTVANGAVNTEVIQKNALLEYIYQWFTEQLRIYIALSAPGKADYDDLITYLSKSELNKKTLLKLIELADIPILDIQVLEVAGGIEGLAAYPYDKPNNKGQVHIHLITKHHLGEDAPSFDFFTEESHGSQQFLAWLGSWLLRLQEGAQPKIFVVDELGSNLHPLLTQLMIKLFYSKTVNPHNAQLIFTTHEVKVMDRAIMRPDQLYLLNKTEHSSTMLRVSDFEGVDQYQRLDNLYMHSGLSGLPKIPAILDIDQILAEIC